MPEQSPARARATPPGPAGVDPGGGTGPGGGAVGSAGRPTASPEGTPSPPGSASPAGCGQPGAGSSVGSAVGLPPGTLAVAGGLVVAGLAAYGFITAASRALGPVRYAPLSVLWATVFVVVPGLFLPLEQEVARLLAARVHRGEPTGGVVGRAAGAAAVAVAVVSVVVAVAAGPVADALFRGDRVLVVALVAALAAGAAGHLVRGALAGVGAFAAYAVFLGAEATGRVAGAVALAVAGVRSPGPYGLALAGGTVLGLVAVAPALARRAGAGRPVGWREVTVALGALVVASVLTQAMLTAGPVATELLAGPAERAAAGRFLNGAAVARVPLFFFQAVQAALLPALTRSATAGARERFRWALVRLVVSVVALVTVGAVAAGLVGPALTSVVFGEEFRLAGTDLVALTAASGLAMIGVVCAQALVARGRHARVGPGWAVGVAVLVVMLAWDGRLLWRVERAMLVGSAAAAAALAVMVAADLRRWSAASDPAGADPTGRS